MDISRALSSSDMRKLLDEQISLYPYEALVNFHNIDDVFGKHDCLVLLYETSDHMGHWIGLIRRNNNIEFFDSYGIPPDSELAFVPQYYRTVFHEDKPHLTHLLEGSGRRIIHNPYDFQSKKSDVATCGRHVACRLALKDMPIKEYKNIIEELGSNPDEVVTFITDKILV